jgi:cell division protein FtsI (penicillin-binding protein 3)
VVFGRYSKTKVLTDFMAVLPADQPRYLLLIMLDEPHPTPERTASKPRAGTRCRPVARWSRGLRRLLGIQPRLDLPPADQLILASLKESR